MRSSIRYDNLEAVISVPRVLSIRQSNNELEASLDAEAARNGHGISRGSLQIASRVADGVYKAQLSTLVNPHSE